MQVLHSHFTHFAAVTQVLHSRFTHCEIVMQALHGHFTRFAAIKPSCTVIVTPMEVEAPLSWEPCPDYPSEGYDFF